MSAGDVIVAEVGKPTREKITFEYDLKEEPCAK